MADAGLLTSGVGRSGSVPSRSRAKAWGKVAAQESRQPPGTDVMVPFRPVESGLTGGADHEGRVRSGPGAEDAASAGGGGRA
jgi:hypothetical protein